MARAIERRDEDWPSPDLLCDVPAVCALLERLNQATTLDEVFGPSLEAIGSALHCDRPSIKLCDEEGRMRFRAWRGLSEEYRQALDGWSPLPATQMTKEPVILSDVEREPIIRRFLPQLRQEGIAALGYVPLLHQGAVLGTLVVCGRTPRRFSDSELRLAKLIAAQVANAVARAMVTAQLDEARKTAERMSHQRDELLAVVSHELRTPLVAILGWAALLHDSGEPGSRALRKGLDAILRNARHQSQMIEQVVEASRIVTGAIELERRELSLTSLVSEVIEAQRADASAKDLSLHFDHEPETVMISGDSQRLRQILSNLLSNAIKFTPPGGLVRTSLRRTETTAELIVQDTGVGMAPEFLAHLFDRFTQEDMSSTRPSRGLGLGLAIARHLVELHGGTIIASSPGHGRGSTFRVSLPIRAPDSTAPPIPAALDG